jgi:ketosteroid isomerase-like protein
MANTDVVRAALDAYLAQDLDAARRLLADDLAFTSPQDDHIDKTAFLERCFPTADRVRRQEILLLAPADTDNVYVTYEYELHTGEVHRNTELTTVRDGQIHEIQVFFGGRYR